MFRFLSNTSHTSPKLFFIGALILFLIIIIAGVMSTGSYTFFSRAEDQEKTITFEQVSVSPVTVPSEDLPQCVNTMSYLPTRTDDICFSQFECEEDPSATDFCSVENGLVTCELPPGQCIQRDQYIRQAAEVCGCGAS